MADDLETEELLAAYISRDLRPDERARVECRLKEDPKFRALERELSELNQLLNKGNLASQALNQKLNERLSEGLRARLPAAVFNPQTVLPAADSSKHPQLFMAPQRLRNRWRQWATAAAAVILVVGGAAAISCLIRTKTGKPQTVAINEPPSVSNTHAANVHTEGETGEQPQANVDVENNQVPNRPMPEGQPEEFEPPKSNKQVAPAPKITTSRPPPVETVHENTATSDGENKTAPASGQTSSPASTPGGGTAVSGTQSNTHSSTSSPSSSSQSTTPANPAPSQPTQPPEQAVTPVPNKAVVGAKQGKVQASGMDNLDVKDQLPSGTEIITGQGKVALLFPGPGRLNINDNSDLVFEINEKTISVTLRAGEINWRSSSGSLNVTAGNFLVSNAKGVDVKLAQNQLIACVTAKTAAIGPKGKMMVVSAGYQVVVNASGMPIKSSFTGQPDNWSTDLVVPGDPTPALPDIDPKNAKKNAHKQR